MVEHRLDEVFQALGHPTRRAMLVDLAAHERSVGQLGEPFAISFAAASKHVRVLERAGLVERRVAGRKHFCRLSPGPLEDAVRWLVQVQRFWPERVDALEAELLRQDWLS